MLLSALLNNSREQDEAIKVFGHLRGRIFHQHLHLVHEFAVDLTCLATPVTILAKIFAGIALFAFGAHSLNDFTDFLGIDTEAVEPDLENVAVQVLFRKLIIVNEEIRELESGVLVANNALVLIYWVCNLCVYY